MKLGALRQLTQNVPELEGPQLQQWLRQQLVGLGMDPNAIYQELEMTSPYVDTHRDISYSAEHMQLHSHAFFELLYCCSSCGAEYLVGSERYRLQQGDIVFVFPGVSHRPLLPEKMEEPYSRYVLWLTPEFVAQYARLFPDVHKENRGRSGMLRTHGTRWAHLGELFHAGVREAEEQKEGWEVAVIGNTITLLTELTRATGDRDARRAEAEKPELLDRIAAFVEENYAKSITIADLARVMFVSSSTVSHLFKQKMGVSFYRYVTQRRLIAAKALIEKGLLLETVATEAGFQDYSGFYRAFKQEYGISPRQYRALQEADR